jgi:hypothetical protein
MADSGFQGKPATCISKSIAQEVDDPFSFFASRRWKPFWKSGVRCMDEIFSRPEASSGYYTYGRYTYS